MGKDNQIDVFSSNGSFVIKADTGEIISRQVEPNAGRFFTGITKFDMEEFRKYYNYQIEEMPGRIDILDLGYWYMHDGWENYERPAQDWRDEFSKHKGE